MQPIPYACAATFTGHVRPSMVSLSPLAHVVAWCWHALGMRHTLVTAGLLCSLLTARRRTLLWGLAASWLPLVRHTTCMVQSASDANDWCCLKDTETGQFMYLNKRYLFVKLSVSHASVHPPPSLSRAWGLSVSCGTHIHACTHAPNASLYTLSEDFVLLCCIRCGGVACLDHAAIRYILFFACTLTGIHWMRCV